MEIRTTDTFFKSLRKIHLTKNPFYIHFWTNLYTDMKWIIWSLIKYFKIASSMRPWEYSYILRMMEFQLKILRDEIRDKGIEVDEDRLPKVEKMTRAIELINNQIKENFAERCGYIYTDMEFEEVEEKENGMKLYKLKKDNDEIEEKNTKALKDGHKLEEEEWNELFELLKDMRRWWY